MCPHRVVMGFNLEDNLSKQIGQVNVAASFSLESFREGTVFEAELIASTSMTSVDCTLFAMLLDGISLKRNLSTLREFM